MLIAKFLFYGKIASAADGRDRIGPSRLQVKKEVYSEGLLIIEHVGKLCTVIHIMYVNMSTCQN